MHWAIAALNKLSNKSGANALASMRARNVDTTQHDMFVEEDMFFDEERSSVSDDLFIMDNNPVTARLIYVDRQHRNRKRKRKQKYDP